MNTLFLGGTGFIGPPMVRALLDAGHDVTLMHRGKTGDELFPELEHIHADRDPANGGLNQLRGRRWDAVVDTSGYVPRVVRASCEALRDACDRYLFISTVSVYENAPDGLDETSTLKALEDPATEVVDAKTYGGLKVLCEQAVSDTYGEDRALVIRPGVIAGPGDVTDRFTWWVLRGSEPEPFIAPEPARSEPIQCIDVRDLAEWTSRLIDDGRTGVLNAVGPGSPWTVGELIAACIDGGRPVWLDEPSLREAEIEYWKDLPLVTDPESSNRSLYLVSDRRAKEAGLTHRPVAETIRATREWAASIGRTSSDLTAGLTRAREREILRGA